MKTLIIFLALVVCCLAVPVEKENLLTRPSPINPAIASDVKPKEKVTIIKDQKGIEEHKQHQNAPTPAPAPVLPTRADTKTTETAIKSRRSGTKTENSQSGKPATTSKKPVVENQRQKREANEQINLKTSTSNVEELKHDDKHQTFIKTTPSFEKSDLSETTNHKRDIPVPLIAKHEHPEESTKPTSTISNTANIATLNDHKDGIAVEELHHHPNDDSAVIHPAVRPHPVPVSELFARPIPHSIN